MLKCIELAKKGFGKVAPNPMVGCVIVHENKIISKGYHKNFGEAHAEINAINSVKHKSLLKKSVLYVNLEPCSHFGKTPPCADFIIRNKIKYVVIGNMDTNPFVSGKGIQKLISAGCNVQIGVLEDKCKELNIRFFTFHEKKRPYVILKWAETKDKFIGTTHFRLQISGNKANKLVHQWRSEEQAVMVGTNTALTDNPKLTVRLTKGKNPLRIVIDKSLRIPSWYNLFNKQAPTLVFTASNKISTQNLQFVNIDFSKNVLQQILTELYERNIQSVIVEGGAKLLNSFIAENLWDEARIFTNNRRLNQKGGIAAPHITGKEIEKRRIENDVLRILKNIY